MSDPMTLICGLPRVGDTAKVWLPGETPWAECVAVHDGGTWDGRIVNKLFAERSEFERTKIGRDFFPGSPAAPLPSLHDFKQNQIVRFMWADPENQDRERWVPFTLASL